MSFVFLILFFLISFTVAAAVVVGLTVFSRRFGAEVPVSRVRLDPDDANPEPEPGEVLKGIFKKDELSSITLWNSFLSKLDFIAILGRTLDQAGVAWTAGRMTMAMLFCATVATALTWDSPWIPSWLAMLLVPMAALIPYFWILKKRTARFRKFREAFPDALDTFARALRAGSPVAGAIQSVGEETPDPVGQELRKLLAENMLGMPLDQALDNLANRIPTTEVSLFVSALQIHGRTGGRLGDVMARLSESIRDSVALEGEVRSVAAHGKLTGLILTMLPVGIAGMMTFVSPGYLKILIDYPIGKDLIAAAIGCLILAHFVIRKLVQIEI